MTSILIVLVLAAAAVAVIVLVRRQSLIPSEPVEADTAWNDPVGDGVDQEARSRDDGTR